MSAERVWEYVRDEFYASNDDAVQGLTGEQVRRRMYKLAAVPRLSLVQGSVMSFFLFHRVYAHQGAKVEHLIGWGHPEIIDKLKYKGVTLCVLQSFYQFVVIMVHDQASTCLLPAFYVLSTDQKLELFNVICDFEAGLIKAVLTQFPEAKVHI
ncbi:hypothetical protein PHMEG_00034407 [Phytophthora megakarya]|uniref:Uncharacterized protein n=1 Tax=Phytophthora megakarya TaxID=4795 RepID=A0A225URJ5_9STRA|nr:hypothetical protein PHMEG_00034407 [Phytophthora megakarya]